MIDWSPVVNAAILLLAAVIATLRPAVVKFLSAKADEISNRVAGDNLYALRGFVSEAIAAANQLGGTNYEKKQMAVNYIKRRCDDYGLAVDARVIDTLIEAVLGLEKSVAK